MFVFVLDGFFGTRSDIFRSSLEKHGRYLEVLGKCLEGFGSCFGRFLKVVLEVVLKYLFYIGL